MISRMARACAAGPPLVEMLFRCLLSKAVFSFDIHKRRKRSRVRRSAWCQFLTDSNRVSDLPID